MPKPILRAYLHVQNVVIFLLEFIRKFKVFKCCPFCAKDVPLAITSFCVSKKSGFKNERL